MAVLPNTVTFTSSYSALSYFVAFALADDSAFPSRPVLRNLPASSGFCVGTLAEREDGVGTFRPYVFVKTWTEN